jgi:obg-like ATPase 1
MKILYRRLMFLPFHGQVIGHLEEGKDVRLGDWKAADIEILNTFQLLSAKPVVYLV